MSALGRDLVNHLYYGDNLEILTRFISDETVDLVYLDPPFNKSAAYSVIFRDESGRTSDAQMATLEDYWHWGPTPARHYEYLTNSAEHGGAVPTAASALIGALHEAIRPSPLLAYLVEMTVRLVELRRVMKPTGSLYLHCDPTASHYLKIVLDAIFGPRNFRNEIVWKRTSSHNDTGRFGRIHDVLLLYVKSAAAPFYVQRTSLDASYVEKVYRNVDAQGRRYRMDNIAAPNGRGPVYEWHGVTRAWRYTRENMEELYRQGRIRLKADGTANTNGFVRYLDENAGQPVQDWWDDVGVIAAPSKERLGYPTQKPMALLDRVIAASSKPGDTVLDPFCGCGTALESAQESGRNWIGIDISNLAVEVIQDRMRRLNVAVPVFDWPTEMDGARRMVEGPDGRHRFEVWALARLGLPENPRGGDAGIDARIGFTGPGGRLENIVVSVKSGHVGPGAIRDLKGTMTRERSAMGLLFSFEQPSRAALKEAVESGFYRSPLDGHQYPKVVVHTVRELLEEGRLPDLPTRQGIQASIWPIPASTRSVRLRSVAPRATTAGPPSPPDRGAEIRERDRVAASREAPPSPRTSIRGPRARRPSQGSADTE